MAFELREGQGTLFKNTRKQKPNHPDMTGEALINGVKVKISGWTKLTKKGDKFLSLSIQEEGAFQSRSPDPTQSGRRREVEEEELF